jgi:virginiamycin A acetyltransferase
VHYFAVIGKSLHEMESTWNYKKVKVGNHCWIGSNCVLVAGSTIQDGTVVAAGSVVKSDNPPYCVIAGVPAKPVRLIFSDLELEAHLQTLGYDSAYVARIIQTRSSMTKASDLATVKQLINTQK